MSKFKNTTPTKRSKQTISESTMSIDEEATTTNTPIVYVEEDVQMLVNEGNTLKMEKPNFAPLRARDLKGTKRQMQKISVPPNRYTPLKKLWSKVYEPLVEHLNLQVRMNTKSHCVELRTSHHTNETGALQKGVDFVKAFMLGFDIDDATAIIRLDDLYIDSFEIKDVKNLQGDHLSRAIGRIAGKDGKVKFTIENTSKTRIVLADTKIHILGTFQNIKIARDAIVSLILGSPPGKVYANLRTISSRMKERF
ncbi:4367_t:CDS:2 [Ambispora gerdemannii]|uniref:Pre-rRNA-processing protein PNO1 n=1 Tax=Ambispora gerdemannii TaxID=144530 RepID=A0A9N8VP14_9GLOM|nr:4367_t:CDS:2 [Ambispora gerdemannii]